MSLKQHVRCLQQSTFHLNPLLVDLPAAPVNFSDGRDWHVFVLFFVSSNTAKFSFIIFMLFSLFWCFTWYSYISLNVSDLQLVHEKMGNHSHMFCFMFHLTYFHKMFLNPDYCPVNCIYVSKSMWWNRGFQTLLLQNFSSFLWLIRSVNSARMTVFLRNYETICDRLWKFR